MRLNIFTACCSLFLISTGLISCGDPIATSTFSTENAQFSVINYSDKSVSLNIDGASNKIDKTSRSYSELEAAVEKNYKVSVAERKIFCSSDSRKLLSLNGDDFCFSVEDYKGKNFEIKSGDETVYSADFKNDFLLQETCDYLYSYYAFSAEGMRTLNGLCVFDFNECPFPVFIQWTWKDGMYTSPEYIIVIPEDY